MGAQSKPSVSGLQAQSPSRPSADIPLWRRASRWSSGLGSSRVALGLAGRPRRERNVPHAELESYFEKLRVTRKVAGDSEWVARRLSRKAQTYVAEKDVKP